MAVEVIDNFLDDYPFKQLQQLICYNLEFPFSIRSRVNPGGLEEELDNWYAVHILYQEDIPRTPFFNDINNLLVNKLREQKRLNGLMRAKVNFYGHTAQIVEHQPHTDYKFSHKAAVFSLNTCDGFTRIGEDVVNSVENRIVFFDGSDTHNSSSTTTTKGRFNINLNFF